MTRSFVLFGHLPLASGFAGSRKVGDDFQGTSGIAAIRRRRFDPFPLHISLPVAAIAVSNCYNPLTPNNPNLQPFPPPPPQHRDFFFISWFCHYCCIKKHGVFSRVPIVAKTDCYLCNVLPLSVCIQGVSRL